MLIDTHCHLADSAFDPDRAAVLERAWSAGLSRIIVIGESRVSATGALALAASDPRILATVGIHPHDARTWDSEAEAWLRARLGDPRVVAIGEIGLDFHYDHSSPADQRRAFEAQLGLAAEVGKPAVIHAREADEEVAGILTAHSNVTAIFHSFSSGMKLLRAGVALRHYVSFSGMVTFKNWALDNAIRETPLDRLLLETDAPYLAPVPKRGKRNEPAFVRHVAERVASVLSIPVEELIEVTRQNAERVFGLPALTSHISGHRE